MASALAPVQTVETAALQAVRMPASVTAVPHICLHRAVPMLSTPAAQKLLAMAVQRSGWAAQKVWHTLRSAGKGLSALMRMLRSASVQCVAISVLYLSLAGFL